MSQPDPVAPTLRRYSVRSEKGDWLADIVIGSDGWFGAVSDYGDYAYAWRGFAPSDFRTFLAGLNAGYLLSKLSSENTYDGEATEARVRAAVGECEGEQAETERELLEGSSFYTSLDFFLWFQETTIDDASGLAVYTYPSDAKLFVERVWPRFVEMLRAEMAAEAETRDSTVAIVQGGLVLVDAIVRHDGLYLGVSRKHDHNDMGCPGGKVKAGESLEAACLRELHEETGYVGRIVRQVYSGPSTHGTCTAFLVELVGVGQRAPGETGRVAWVPAEDLYAGSFGSFYREALREVEAPEEPVVVWGHSTDPDPEQWTGAFKTRERAIEDGVKTYEGGAFYVVSGRRYSATRYLPTLWRLTNMMATAAGDDNSAARSWEVSRAAGTALRHTLETWARTHVDPLPFWTPVGEPERIETRASADAVTPLFAAKEGAS